MINLRFVNVVWGKAYTDTFVNICLPSQLSSGNLEFVAAHSRSSYHIYTTPTDAETILKSPAGKRLAKIMHLEIARVEAVLPVDDPSVATCPQKYTVMSLCHTHFIKTVGKDGSSMVFLSPDTVWADGSFRRLFEIAQSGKRLVMIGAIRLAKESFIAALHQNHMKGDALQPISKRNLVKLAMNHLHPETESLVWDSCTSNVWPSALLWITQLEGIILRAFHLHPLMVRSIRPDIFPAVTIDDDYIARVCPNPADEYIVKDSDDIVTFELSRRSSRAEFVTPQRQDTARVANWARAHANLKHQAFLENRIRLHSTALSDNWLANEQQSDRIIEEVRSLLSNNTTAASTA